MSESIELGRERMRALLTGKPVKITSTGTVVTMAIGLGALKELIEWNIANIKEHGFPLPMEEDNNLNSHPLEIKSPDVDIADLSPETQEKVWEAEKLRDEAIKITQEASDACGLSSEEHIATIASMEDQPDEDLDDDVERDAYNNPIDAPQTAKKPTKKRPSSKK